MFLYNCGQGLIQNSHLDLVPQVFIMYLCCIHSVLRIIKVSDNPNNSDAFLEGYSFRKHHVTYDILSSQHPGG